MSKISRSTHQKVVEQNKKLLSDIELLVSKDLSAEKTLCINKWRKHFEDQQSFVDAMKHMVKKFCIENYPTDNGLDKLQNFD